jgi:hypothetical protein
MVNPKAEIRNPKQTSLLRSHQRMRPSLGNASSEFERFVTKETSWKIAEDLDAHRKGVKAQHPGLALTGMRT